CSAVTMPGARCQVPGARCGRFADIRDRRSQGISACLSARSVAIDGPKTVAGDPVVEMAALPSGEMPRRRSLPTTREIATHARQWLGIVHHDGTSATPVHLPEPEERAVYRILNFALRAGSVMLASGAGTAEVEHTVLDLCDACGLARCEVDVTFTSLTVSYRRGEDVEPVTSLLVVRRRQVNYHHLAEMHQLRDDMTSGRCTPEQAFERLDVLVATPMRRSWLVVTGWAGMAAAFTVLLGGDTLVAVVGFVSTVAVYLVNRRLARLGIPDFFLSLVGGAVATGFATMLVAVDLPASSSLVVAGGIMVLVPGYALVASVRDAMTGYPISGAARGLEVMLTAAGIISGVAGVLYVASSAGLTLHLGAGPAVSLVHLPAQVIAAGLAGVLYAAATNVPRRSLLGAGLAGAVGWSVVLGMIHSGVSLIVATAAAAVVVGVLGQVLAARQHTHPFLFIVPGVMPLVPGLTIYQGMLDLIYAHGNGAGTLLRALATGLAIAAGVTLGALVVQPTKRRPLHDQPLPRPTKQRPVR
ncbi:MAG: threonine/serine exporter family protein, partial [Actinomycetota bacterium]|nr:threonine/serine exporter family protein [Actinomycetota bacterium]